MYRMEVKVGNEKVPAIQFVENNNIDVTSIVGKTVLAVKLHNSNDYWGDDGFTILFTDGSIMTVGASDDCGFPMVSTAVKERGD